MLSSFEPTPAEFLTIDQVAEVLHLSHQSVRRRIRAGELDIVRIGSGPKAPIRIASGDLIEYLQRVNRG